MHPVAPADADEPSEALVTAEASETPTPSPTPTPVAADPADPSTWLIDAEGIGPLRRALPIDEAVALMPGYIVGTCPNPAVRFLRTDDITDPSIALAAADDGRVVRVLLVDSTGPADSRRHPHRLDGGRRDGRIS